LIEFTQYLAIRYSERLAENDIVASVGWRGDSYDNAMAESVNGLYKWELFYPRGPWRSLDDVEFATLGHVDWFNHRRLHGETTDAAAYVTPAEFEADYYRQRTPALVEVSQTGEQPCNPGWFKMSSSLDSGHLGNRR
jgi:transposase InsO family protein